MEETFPQKSRDRKASYKKAVDVYRVEDQEKTEKFQHGPNNSIASSHVIDVFTSSDADNGFSQGKVISRNSAIEFVSSYELDIFIVEWHS